MMAIMTKKTFGARLERPPGVGTWTYLNVPFNVADEFGTKGQLKVKGSVNGVPYRGSLLPHGDGRHYLVVKSEIRNQAKVSAGDSVHVVLEQDMVPRVVTPPKDFKQALARNPKARAAFARFSYSHQKEFVDWIESAKKADTRARRIESAVAQILAGTRPKGRS